MIDGAALDAVADLIVGVAVAVPVLVVAGAILLVVRGRRGGTLDAPPAGAGTTPPGGSSAPDTAPATAAGLSPESSVGAPPVDTAPAPAPAAKAEPTVEPATYRGRLGKARGLLSGYVGAIRSRARIDSATWDDLEEALIRADVGVGATDAILDGLRARVTSGEIDGPEGLVDALKGDLVTLLSAGGAGTAGRPGEPVDTSSVTSGDAGAEARTVDVWLFVGVNGVGKTTTVGKVATRMAGAGTRVLLAAGDTFRAAAGEQLERWAERSGAEIVRGNEGGDPSSVVFDAVQRAASRGIPVVLADTAGRLHNKVNLIEELKKIRRVADRPPGRVAKVLLVLDATTGQNGLAQAKVFLTAVEATGVVLTKLDGTAKGGIVVAIQRELGLPVVLVGLGEGADDLVDFDPTAFVDALF